MAKTVLVLLDLQQGLIDMSAKQRGLKNVEDAKAYMLRVSETVQAARMAGIPIIFVTISFRKGQPEISPHNRTARKIKQMSAETGEAYLDGDASTQVHPDIASSPDDIFITKRRVSAFSGSDLAVVLRGLQAQQLVLCGLATSGVVLSTVREAADLDYELVVLKDLCIDPDPEVQRVLVEKVFVRQADVMDSAEWLAGLGSD